MSTKRTPKRRDRTPPLTAEVVAAWHQCNMVKLHGLLGLLPSQHSPLPASVTPYGVAEDRPPDPDGTSIFDFSWGKALALQRALLAAAGPPRDRRIAFEKNLRDAEGMANYYRDCLEHPERAGIGTGCDPASLRQSLEKAEGEVAYYRGKLLGLRGREAV
jgi:hypothetical protein